MPISRESIRRVTSGLEQIYQMFSTIGVVGYISPLYCGEEPRFCTEYTYFLFRTLLRYHYNFIPSLTTTVYFEDDIRRYLYPSIPLFNVAFILGLLDLYALSLFLFIDLSHLPAIVSFSVLPATIYYLFSNCRQ